MHFGVSLSVLPTLCTFSDRQRREENTMQSENKGKVTNCFS
jgi:hypothetical protein